MSGEINPRNAREGSVSPTIESLPSIHVSPPVQPLAKFRFRDACRKLIANLGSRREQDSGLHDLGSPKGQTSNSLRPPLSRGDSTRSLSSTLAYSTPQAEPRSRKSSQLSFTPVSDDEIIAVVGPTGTGKSTFVKSITNQEVAVGKGLRSCTDSVQAIACSHPSNPQRKLVLVDTPGLDDTGQTDASILEAVGVWLADNYKEGRTLTGLLYFHRITDPRMTGSALRSLHLFRNLVGDTSMKNVVLVTTMWDIVTPKELGLEREQELQMDFWKPMIQHGSRVAQHDGSSPSAHKILELFDSLRPAPTLQIVKELVMEGKPFGETQAGQLVTETISKLVVSHELAIQQLRNEYERALAQKDEQMKKAVAAEQEKVEKLMQELEAAKNRMKKRWWNRWS